MQRTAVATFVLRSHCRRPHPASPHASSLLRGHLQQSVSPGAGPAAAAGGWEVARCTRHVQGAVPAEPGRGRGCRPRAAENELCSSLLGRSPRAGVPSPSPSPIGDAEVRRGWVTSPVPGAQHAAEPGVRSVPRSVPRPISLPCRAACRPGPAAFRGPRRVHGDARLGQSTGEAAGRQATPRAWARRTACARYSPDPVAVSADEAVGPGLHPVARAACPPSHTAVGERRRPKARPGALHQASRPPGGQRREGPGHLLSCGPRKARLAVPRRAERLLSNASLGGQHMSTPGHTRGTLSGAHTTRTHARAPAHTHTPPRPEPRTARFPGLQLVAHQELMQYHAHTITEKFYAVFCQVFLYNSFITSLTASIKIPGILYQQPSLY